MPVKHYLGAGQCAICLNEYGPVILTDEHIIPDYLSGRYILKKGTCKSCNGEASRRYEHIASNSNFLVPRLLLELKRRRRNKKPLKSFPKVALNTNGLADSDIVFDIELQLIDYPKQFNWIVFTIPGKLGGMNKGSEMRALSVQQIDLGIDMTLYPQGVGTLQVMSNPAFALTIAKIGYCYAVGELGLDGFDGTEIRDVLTGRRDDVYNFVGSAHDSETFRIPQLHHLSHTFENDLLVVRVALFASCGARPLLVVVGKRLSSGFVARIANE